MSKMPAKKKSCFQITSVTSAQAACSIAEDSESLDGELDEPRPEGEAGPRRSSSDEALQRSPGSASPGPGPQPRPATCSSRFRVIKLDHGSGEPYRRGRWTCLEFYDREPDSFRHGSFAEQGSDRDSGLGGSHPGAEAESGYNGALPSQGPAAPQHTGQSPAAQRTNQGLPPSSDSAGGMPSGPHPGGAPVPGMPSQNSHATVTRSTSLVQPAHSALPPAAPGHIQTQPSLPQIDDRRKSEPLPQPPLSLISDHRHFMKPTVLDSLHLPVTTPMNALTSSVFGITIPLDGDEDSASSANSVAIDNKIEQAMDLVKSHLMYAVREEVEVLKEQIKELIERNSSLERENALLKSLTNNDQLAQLSTQSANLSSTSQQQTLIAQPPQTAQPPQQPKVSSA